VIKAIQPIQSATLDEANSPALRNHAVAQCAAAWQRVYQAVLAKSKSDYAAEREAGKAFRHAMPLLCGYENICDFIACAGYGVLIGAIQEAAGSKLLYAAQVALSTINQKSKSQTRSAT